MSTNETINKDSKEHHLHISSINTAFKETLYQEVESVMYQAFAERNFEELALKELYVTSDNGKEIIKAMKTLGDRD